MPGSYSLFRGKNIQNQQQKCWLINMMLQIKLAMLPLLSYLDLQLSYLTIFKKIQSLYGTQWDWQAPGSLLCVNHWFDDDGGS